MEKEYCSETLATTYQQARSQGMEVRGNAPSANPVALTRNLHNIKDKYADLPAKKVRHPHVASIKPPSLGKNAYPKTYARAICVVQC